MKQPYRNSERSKQMIKDALISLLNKKSLSEVTVADIVRTAGINRGTFYNHYGNPIEILEEMKQELLDKLKEALKTSTQQRSVDSLVDTLLDHLEKNEQEYRKIVGAIPMQVIEQLKKEFIAQIESFKLNFDRFNLYLIVNAMAGLYIDYLKGDLKIDAKTLGEKTKEFIRRNLV